MLNAHPAKASSKVLVFQLYLALNSWRTTLDIQHNKRFLRDFVLTLQFML